MANPGTAKTTVVDTVCRHQGLAAYRTPYAEARFSGHTDRDIETAAKFCMYLIQNGGFLRITTTNGCDYIDVEVVDAK